MSGADALKAQIKSLGDQRAALEREVAQRSARLEAAGGGLSGPLVDSEGFPRADVDVAAIRADRHAIITLTNDHKALSRQLESLLLQLHSFSNSTQAGSGGGANLPPNGHLPTAAAGLSGAAARPAAGSAVAAPPPFAVVDELTPRSPAAEAGLQLGDQLCRCGNVTRQTPGALAAMAAHMQASEGRAVEAVVLRHGAPLVLALTPRRWSGPGLLGCHLRPL